MYTAFTNGTEYLIVRAGKVVDGWSVLDGAATADEARARCHRDWDYYWSVCGVIPSRPIRVSVAQPLT